eukprot:173991-Chlamydomonas_euryale.AAC.1
MSFLAWDRAGFDIVAVQETWTDRSSGRTAAELELFLDDVTRAADRPSYKMVWWSASGVAHLPGGCGVA